MTDNLGKMQEWNLSDLYSSMSDPQIEQDLKKAEELCGNFAKKYKGNVTSLGAADLLECMKSYDDIGAIESKLGIYAALMSAKNQQKYSAFERKISQKLTDIGTQTVFFELELAKTPMDEMQAKISQEPKLELYRVVLEDAVKMQPHMLGEEAETVLTKQNLTARRAWSNFYDELDSRIRFDYNGKKMGIEEIKTYMKKPDRNVRKESCEAMYKGIKENLWLYTYITNTLSLDNSLDDEMHHMPNPIRRRNMSNNISDETVKAMNKAINEAYPRVSHRYYELLREMLGVEKLKGYDRNAPLKAVEEEVIPYDKAKDMVLGSYREFSPQMADIAQKFFDNDWIDAPVTEGKASGAFAMPAVRGVHPYVMLNYLGTRHDVATMAHELGHGIHQYLADQHLQSQIAADTPLTVAETASVFGERIIFENLLEQEKDKDVRVNMLAGKISDMINTVVRQNAFFNFEQEMHDTRKEKGEDLEAPEINKIYMKTQKEALGPAFDLDDDYGMEWAYVSHFIHTPYYVYSYAFGDCLVNSLYSKYEEAENKKEFVEKYTNMLKLGGSKSPNEMVKAFNLDLEDPKFWDGGMSAIEKLIDKLEVELGHKPTVAPKKQNNAGSKIKG